MIVSSCVKNTLGTNWVQRLPFWLIWKVKVSLHLWSYLLLASLLTPADGAAGMFSIVSVCLQGGVPHGTVSRDALELTIQGPSAPTLPLDMGPHCIGTTPPPVTSGSQDRRPVQIWSLEDPQGTDIWWLLKHVRLASMWYASYWDVFLLLLSLPVDRAPDHGSCVRGYKFYGKVNYCPRRCTPNFI